MYLRKLQLRMLIGWVDQMVDNYNPKQVVVGAKFKTGTQWAYTNKFGTKNPDDGSDSFSSFHLAIWLFARYTVSCEVL